MYCCNCGTKIPEDALFWREAGCPTQRGFRCVGGQKLIRWSFEQSSIPTQAKTPLEWGTTSESGVYSWPCPNRGGWPTLSRAAEVYPINETRGCPNPLRLGQRAGERRSQTRSPPQAHPVSVTQSPQACHPERRRLVRLRSSRRSRGTPIQLTSRASGREFLRKNSLKPQLRRKETQGPSTRTPALALGRPRSG